MAVFNAGESVCKTDIALLDLDISTPVQCTDLWSGEKTDITESIPVQIPPHGAQAFLLK